MPGKVSAQRCEDAFIGVVAAGAQHAFGDQRFHAFDDDAAEHFCGGRRAHFARDDLGRDSKRRKLFDEFLRTVAARQHRHFVAIGRNGSHHRDFGEARARGFDYARDGLLHARRNGIEVGVNVIGGQMRRVLLGCVQGLIRRYRGHHDVAGFGQFPVRFHQERFRFPCALPNLGGDVDVESRDGSDARLPQALWR